MWINWIKTQSFATRKTYFPPHREPTSFPPPQASYSPTHSLPVTAALPKQDVAASAEPRSGFTQGRFQARTLTLFPVDGPKASLLCSSNGQFATGGHTRGSSVTSLSMGVPEPGEIHVCYKVPREKGSHQRWGKPQSLLKNESFLVLFLHIVQRLHQLSRRRVQSLSRS